MAKGAKTLLYWPQSSLRLELRPRKPERLMATQIGAVGVNGSQAAAIQDHMHVFAPDAAATP